jgi:heme-degrading monooxygenase HmoA
MLLVWDNIENVQIWRDSAEFKEIRAVGQKYAKFRAFTVEGLPR